MRLAIFGGTFDPIHQAHLAIAREAAERCRLDRVLLVPADNPPHKTAVPSTPYEDRVRMAELACQGSGSPGSLAPGRRHRLELLHRYHRKSARAHWTPDDELFFVIGADAFADIRTWQRWQDVARAVCFLVVSRPGAAYEVPPEVRIQRLDRLELPISSSEIRRQLAAGQRPAEVPRL